MTGRVDLAAELGAGLGHCFKHLVFSFQNLPCKDIKEENDTLTLPFQSTALIEVWSSGD